MARGAHGVEHHVEPGDPALLPAAPRSVAELLGAGLLSARLPCAFTFCSRLRGFLELLLRHVQAVNVASPRPEI